MKRYFLLKNLILLIVLATVSFSCQKDNNTLTLTTTDVSEIYPTTAVSGGNITDDGGSIITECGVCWNTSATPTIANSKNGKSYSEGTGGAGTGMFTRQIAGLTANTEYFVRAYATNSAGTIYGAEKIFTTSDFLSISEGNFIGTTGENEDVYLHINGESKIDSIAVKIEVDLGSFDCIYTFYCKTDIQVDETTRQFEAKLTNPYIFICGESDYPILKGTCADDNNFSGTISEFEECGGYCGSQMAFGTGSTVAEQTWSVIRGN